MAFIRIPVVLLIVTLLASACSGDDVSDTPVITRALLPATPTPETSTTTVVPPTPVEADQIAQTELREVLAAARELFSEKGTFDATPDEVSFLAPSVEVITLEDAALRPGVVYDAHNQRVTLHNRSTSGRWFCIDVSDDGDDFGFGESFEDALSTCTDRILATGWGQAFSPTGPDESSIKATLGALATSLAIGDARAAHAAFDSETACSLAALLEAWPGGLALTDSEDFELWSISVHGDQATALAAYGSFPQASWELRRHQGNWRVFADPCELVEPELEARTSAAARELLEQGLFAVRSSFVVRQDFAFPARALEELDGTLVLVPTGDLAYGTLSYSGSTSQGLLITTSGRAFYCAVESLSAGTVYGTGPTVDQVATPDRCAGAGG